MVPIWRDRPVASLLTSTETALQIIKKVLNSSVVLVRDEYGLERVVLGKGIGFGRKPGAEVPVGAIDQVFVSLPDADQRNLVELLAQIPETFIDLTREIVTDATSQGLELDPHVYLTLTDHLHFAVERQRRGLRVVNRLAWEVKTVYPIQYAVGQRAITRLIERLGVTLPDEEAANIAFHLVNAEVGKVGIDSLQIVQLISRIVQIVSNTGAARLSRDDLHSSRFVAHLQYFAERFFAGKLSTSADDFLYNTLKGRYPGAVESAERVRTFVQMEYGSVLPNEEVAYLALHIARNSPH